jgi:retinol dehydrogenase-12
MATSMDGKLVLITGGTAGIGKQSAIALLQMGAQVVIVGRNPEKTKAVVEELKTRTGSAKVDSLLADLSSLGEIRALAAEFKARFPRLDVLLNNAGGMNPARSTTVDGYERTMATNHLGYFLLANELLPLLEKSGPARIVNVASDAHKGGRLDFDDLMAEKSYFHFRQYSRSKAANILFTRELARRLAGKNVTVNCLHPGFVASDFLSKGGFWGFIKPIAYLFAINEVDGAKTSVYLASSPEVEGVTGKYFVKCKATRPTAFCEDDEAAKRLWELSEKLVAAKVSARAA